MAIYLFILIFLPLAVLALDQFTKVLVVSNLGVGETFPATAEFIRVAYVRNYGTIFGLFQNAGNDIFLWVAATVTIGITAVYIFSVRAHWLYRLGLGLIVGGALGNVIDRIRYGFVVDFISVGAFPIFNIADSAINVGAGLLILYLLFFSKKKTSSPSMANPEVAQDISETQPPNS